MDHYKVLGLTRKASKEEIKDAFRKLALQFHPDRHAQSPKPVREDATHKFKQVSEAYETLIDERKRADYNLRYASSGSSAGAHAPGSCYRYNGGYGYGNSYRTHGRGSCSASSAEGRGLPTKFELALRFLTTRAFFLNLAFAGTLLGGLCMVDMGREHLWKMQNSGKSFGEAMESIEKARAQKK